MKRLVVIDFAENLQVMGCLKQPHMQAVVDEQHETLVIRKAHAQQGLSPRLRGNVAPAAGSDTGSGLIGYVPEEYRDKSLTFLRHEKGLDVYLNALTGSRSPAAGEPVRRSLQRQSR